MQKFVNIQGIMTWDDTITSPPEPPGGGGGSPPHPDHTLPLFPSHPIVVPPGGVWPLPPGIWPGAHPSHPIILPGMPGWEGKPPVGPVDPDAPHPEHPIVIFPEPPIEPPIEPPVEPPGEWTPPSKPNTPPGISQPIAPIPGPGGIFVVYWSPVFGWVMVPADGWQSVKPPTPEKKRK